MVTSLIRPSYHQGFTTRSLSKRPNLWRGAVGVWNPSLGISGLRVRDLTGKGNHMEFDPLGDGGMTMDSWATGNLPQGGAGHSLALDSGNTEYMGTSTNLGITAYPFTFLVWTKTTDTTNDCVFSMGSSGSTNKLAGFVHRGATGIIRIQTQTDGGNDTFDGVIVINDGLWHQIIGVWASATDRRLYIDGVPDGTDATNVPFDTGGADRLFYGRWADSSPGNAYTGTAGIAIVYNRILNVPEIADSYLHPNAMFEPRDVIIGRVPAVAGGRIMSSLVNAGGLAGMGGIAGRGGGLCG